MSVEENAFKSAGEGQTDSATQSVLTGLANKINETDEKVNKQSDKIDKTYNITALGFVLALIMVGTLVITVFLWTINSFEQTNQQTVLLQQINTKLSK